MALCEIHYLKYGFCISLTLFSRLPCLLSQKFLQEFFSLVNSAAVDNPLTPAPMIMTS